MPRLSSYLSLIKFSHTIFAMPFALIGFFLAWAPMRQAAVQDDYRYFNGCEGCPENANGYLLRFLFIILCMVFARSAAMAFNRYLDRQFDARNPRTAGREIPAGIISARNALAFTLLSSLLFIVSAYFINRICFYLSPVALAVVLGYSYTKRFTWLCHLVLGLGLSLAPIGAWLAVTGAFHWLPLLFSGAVICWVSGFDIIYALQDEDFDREQELHSIPAAMGKRKALFVSRLLHIASASFVFAAGWFGGFQIWYWAGFAIFAGMLIYQQSIVKPSDLSRVNLAFMTANGIASVVFAIFVITDLLFRH